MGRRGSPRSQERAKIHDLVLEGIGLALRKRGYPAMEDLTTRLSTTAAYDGRWFSALAPESRIRKIGLGRGMSPKHFPANATAIGRRKTGAGQESLFSRLASISLCGQSIKQRLGLLQASRLNAILPNTRTPALLGRLCLLFPTYRVASWWLFNSSDLLPSSLRKAELAICWSNLH